MSDEKKCVLCQRTQDEVPLIEMVYKGKALNICPQHIPVLIHEPQKLAEILPDAENFGAG